MTETFDLSGTSPSAASTTAAGAMASGLARYLGLRVEAQLLGATGGTLDVYLQRKVAPNLWVDWAHFPQLAAGASAVAYSFVVHSVSHGTTTIAAITTRGSDATPAPGLGASTLDLVHPGEQIRVVYVSGSGTSAGAAIKVYVTGLGPT